MNDANSLQNSSPLSQIVLLRHAEKPETGKGLSELGHKRACAIPLLFESHPLLKDFGKPIALYAAAQEGPDGSIRSIQTLIPLAEHFGLGINQSFTKNDVSKLVEHILKNPHFPGRMIVVCWSHKNLPEIGKFLGAKGVPDNWDEKVFDRFWVIKLKGTLVTQFIDLPQNLLPGDQHEK